MIWDTSIWRLGCSNHSKIRSAQKCYPCLRYELSPMSPGRTSKEVVGAKGFEPSTSWSRTRHLNPINALFGVAYGTPIVRGDSFAHLHHYFRVARSSGTIAKKMRRRTASPENRLSFPCARVPSCAHIREGAFCWLTPRCTCILGCGPCPLHRS